MIDLSSKHFLYVVDIRTLKEHLDKNPFKKCAYTIDCVITAHGENSIFLELVCMPKLMFTLKTVAALRQLL